MNNIHLRKKDGKGLKLIKRVLAGPYEVGPLKGMQYLSSVMQLEMEEIRKND